MRVIIGLSLLALANAQSLQLSGSNTGNSAASPTPGSQAEAIISVQQSNSGGAFVNAATNITPPNSGINGNVIVPTNNYSIQLPNSVSYAYVTVKTNQYTGQLQHRWSGSVYTAGLPSGVSQFTYTCDICAGSTLSSCNTPSGPGTVTNGGANVGTSPASGYLCANLSRNYLFGPLVSSTPTTSTPNTLAFALYDLTPIVSSYSLVFYRAAPAIIVGDPQIVGMQGQDFQVHGMPDEVFNLVTYPNLQINSRFVYLSSGECHDNFTACFAHPGTYISDEGIRLGSDKIHVRSGSFKKGLTVSVNGKKVKDRSTTSLKLGSVEIVNHRRVVITSPVMTVSISNSDHFLNQELELHDEKLVALGSKRRVLKDGEAFHSEVPLHGLQGQTWRNVEYPSGLDYEGTILDYMVNDGDIFGTDFVFNKFQL